MDNISIKCNLMYGGGCEMPRISNFGGVTIAIYYPHMDGVLEKLKETELFKQVFVDEELWAVSWPGELDIDPDNFFEDGILIKAVENLTNAVKTKVAFVDYIDQ